MAKAISPRWGITKVGFIIVMLFVMSVLIFLSVLPASETGHQATQSLIIDSDVASLAGLDGVTGLVVEDVDPDVAKSGLSKADVRAEIEVLLYKHGVLKQGWKSSDPLLHVQVGTFKIGNVYAFTVRLEFLQNMLFDRPMPKASSRLFIPKRPLVATWSDTAVGAAPDSDLSEIRRALRDVTTKFIADFRKANDKQP